MGFSRILIPLDGSVLAESVLEHAGRIGRAFSSHIALLQVLQVDNKDADLRTDSINWRLRKAEAERYLRNMAQDPRLAGLEVETTLTEGKPADRIVDFIRRNGINLVMMSAWGAGDETDFPVGGTVHKVLISTDVSYLIAREPVAKSDQYGYRRVLVPLDGSQKAELAAYVASALDVDHDEEIVLLHIVSQPPMPRRRPLTEDERVLQEKLIDCNRRVAAGYLEALRDKFRQQHAVRTRLEVALHPIRCIAEISCEEQPDLVILSAHGGTELYGWSTHSILLSVLAAVKTPVLALQDDIQSPEDLPHRLP